MSFRALRLHKTEEKLEIKIEDLEDRDLPAGNTTVDVRYSSINYKDALAVTGKGKIVRGAFPFIPGIDLAGTVISSESKAFPAGLPVIGTGWGLGEQHGGGFTQRERLDHRWLVPLPEGMTLRQAMGLGTAGFTAMLSVMTLEEHGILPPRGEIVVTGATGGVGSISVALLARLGYLVVASTGKKDAHQYLEALGAARIIDRSVLGAGPKRPMDTAVWAGAIDTVGGDTLAALLSQTDRHGAIAACGLAGGAELHTTVFPFILRGVHLLGIDSNTCPADRRQKAWNRLADLMPADLLDSFTRVVPLHAVPEQCEAMMAGRTRGRLVVDLLT